MPDPKAKRPATVWDRLALDGGASGGYDLAACVLVGLGLGWLVQRWFPGCRPWGFVGGIVLGSVSGFYQLFKTQLGLGDRTGARAVPRRQPREKARAKDPDDHERPA